MCVSHILAIYFSSCVKLLAFSQENFNELKGALEGADHSWTALTLKVYCSPDRLRLRLQLVFVDIAGFQHIFPAIIGIKSITVHTS